MVCVLDVDYHSEKMTESLFMKKKILEEPIWEIQGHFFLQVSSHFLRNIYYHISLVFATLGSLLKEEYFLISIYFYQIIT